MHKRQKQHFILGAAVLALVACASTGPDAVKSDDPTTQAISEKYVETPEDVAVPTSGSAGFSGGGGDDEVVVTGARIRGSKERSAPPAAPVMMMPEPSVCIKPMSIKCCKVSSAGKTCLMWMQTNALTSA